MFSYKKKKFILFALVKFGLLWSIHRQTKKIIIHYFQFNWHIDIGKLLLAVST